jgi:hypothetical protein
VLQRGLLAISAICEPIVSIGSKWENIDAERLGEVNLNWKYSISRLLRSQCHLSYLHNFGRRLDVQATVHSKSW